MSFFYFGVCYTLHIKEHIESRINHYAPQAAHHHPMKVRRAHLEYLIRIASGDGTFTVNLHAPGSGRTTVP